MDFLELCEHIDAAVFSGDSLFDDEKRKEFHNYLGRWIRESNDEKWEAEENDCEYYSSGKCSILWDSSICHKDCMPY